MLLLNTLQQVSNNFELLSHYILRYTYQIMSVIPAILSQKVIPYSGYSMGETRK